MPTPIQLASDASAEAGPKKAWNGKWVLAATILGSSMAFIDGTVVTVALPALQTSLHASAEQIQWVIEAYALFLAALLLAGGSLGDLLGRRIVFVVGVVVFALASAWCGFAHSITALIAARGVQGVGAALLVPGSLALISASFPESERGKAIGTWSGFSAITASVGPVLGGWLVDHASWRWVFFLNLPLAVAILAITFMRVSESRNEQVRESLDWSGTILITVALAGITFALIEVHRPGVAPVLAAIVGVIALASFLLVEAHAPAPMLPLALFRSRDFAGANLLTLFLYTALSGLLFFLPLNLIQVQHYSATQAGAALLPLILLIFLLSRWSGGLIARYGARLPLTVGPLIAALGFSLLIRAGIGGSYWTTFFPAVVVLGFGMAISVAPLTTAVMNAVPVAQSGVASGVNNAISRLAGLLGVAIFGLVMVMGFRQELTRRLDLSSLSLSEKQSVEAQNSKLAAIRTTNKQVQDSIAEAFIVGFRHIVWISVGLSVAGALCARVLRGETSFVSSAKDAEVERAG